MEPVHKSIDVKKRNIILECISISLLNKCSLVDIISTYSALFKKNNCCGELQNYFYSQNNLSGLSVLSACGTG